MGDGRTFAQKAAATLPLMKIYGMSLVWAGSISLDSTFNVNMETEMNLAP
jgi:hypothetical protein